MSTRLSSQSRTRSPHRRSPADSAPTRRHARPPSALQPTGRRPPGLGLLPMNPSGRCRDRNGGFDAPRPGCRQYWPAKRYCDSPRRSRRPAPGPATQKHPPLADRTVDRSDASGGDRNAQACWSLLPQGCIWLTVASGSLLHLAHCCIWLTVARRTPHRAISSAGTCTRITRSDSCRCRDR